jgi:hypothetical protein
MKRILVWLACGVTAVKLCGAETGAFTTASTVDSSEAALKQRAAAIAKEAFSELSSNLLAAITRTGLNDALPYCSDKAIPITKAVAAKNGVGLSRVTHKARNPANKASEAELAVIRQFQSELTAQHAPAPIAATNATQAVSVYIPIVISNPLCLMCHGKPGTEVSTELQATIRRLYPDDQATGFALGDLRGAWRVGFPPKAGAAPQ